MARTLARLRKVLREEIFSFGTCTPGVFLAQRLANMLPYLMFPRLRTAIYRMGGIRIGFGTVLLGPMRIWGGASLTIGSESLVNGYCRINIDAPVTIGDKVQIGHDVTIITAGHVIGPPYFRAGGGNDYRPVTVENGSWIAANVTLLPGGDCRGRRCRRGGRRRDARRAAEHPGRRYSRPRDPASRQRRSSDPGRASASCGGVADDGARSGRPDWFYERLVVG